jgi:hypothetical protein
MRRWSYDIGLMHIIGLNTEGDFSHGSPQFEWLRGDLASVDRSVTPWVVVAGHRPMYVDSYYAGREDSVVAVSDRMIALLDPLFHEYRVNVAFWAHHHSFQRHAAVFNKRLVQHSEPVQVKVINKADSGASGVGSNAKSSSSPGSTSATTTTTTTTVGTQRMAVYHDPHATVHWVIGTGGADFTCDDDQETPDRPFPHGDPAQPWHAWSEVFFYKYGHALASALNRTHFSVTWKDSSDGSIADAALIVQSDPVSSRAWASDGASDEDDGAVVLGSRGDVIGVGVAFVAAAAVSAVIVFTLNVKQK